MRHNSFPVCIVIASILLVCACSVETGPKNWTIMVWLDGDNNLEYNGIIDFNEMEYGLFLAQSADPEIMNKLNLIVQMDRNNGYDAQSHDRGADWKDTRRYYVLPDSDSNQGGDFVSLKIAELGEVNMGDAYELKDFIGFCKSRFPANNYMLVLWNHGGGVRAVGGTTSSSEGIKSVVQDDTNDDVLYTSELTDVLTASESVDIIGFDACVMGMAEIGYEYRPGVPGKFGADYMVASPPNEGGDGWEYYKILGRFGIYGEDAEGDPIVNAGTLTPAGLSSIVVEEYRDALVEGFSTDNQGYNALAAYDLSAIGSVKTALDSLAIGLEGEKTDVSNYIQGEVSGLIAMHYFNPADVGVWITTPHFDLYDFANRIQSDSTHFSAGSRAAASALMSAVDSCVVYSWAPVSSYPGFTQGVNGLAFFFPGNGTYAGSPYYWYEWWYTAADTNTWPFVFPAPYIAYFMDPSLNYGRIDFCEGDTDGTVDNWRELLEYWYDPLNLYTPGSW